MSANRFHVAVDFITIHGRLNPAYKKGDDFIVHVNGTYATTYTRSMEQKF